jgi:hypothetical protein
MAEAAQGVPAAAGLRPQSTLAAAVHAKPFVPGGYTASSLTRKQSIADASSEPSSPMIKGGASRRAIRLTGCVHCACATARRAQLRQRFFMPAIRPSAEPLLSAWSSAAQAGRARQAS